MKLISLLTFLGFVVLVNCAVPPLPNLFNPNSSQGQDDESTVEVVAEDTEPATGPIEPPPPPPPQPPTSADKIRTLASETNALLQDGIDALARGELVFPPPLNEPTTNALNDVAQAAGGIAIAGGKLAQGALHLQAKLVAPLFLLGAKITAPIVKVKAKLAAPLVFAGAALAKPLVKGAVRLAAPAVAVGKLAAAPIIPVQGLITKGLVGALKPIADATLPLQDALRPLELAAQAGLGPDFNLDEELQNTNDVESDVQQLAMDAGQLVEDAVLLTSAGARVAGEAAKNVAASIGAGVNANQNSRKKRQAPPQVVEEIGDEAGNPFAPPPNFSGNEDGQVPLDNDELLKLFVPREGSGTCEAYRSRLVTSECHREEEYRTRTCSRLDCSALNIEAIHRRCQVSAPGVHCEQDCYSFQDQNGDSCFNCWFRFTRALSTTGKCSDWTDCLFGSRVCPALVQKFIAPGDDNFTLQFFNNQDQRQSQANKRR